jgi:predicted RNA-binding protein Jag
MQIEQMKIQADTQSSQQRLQMESQRDQAAMQLKAQTDQQKLEFDQMKMEFEAQNAQTQHLHEKLMADQAQKHQQAIEQAKINFDKWKIEFDNATKVTVAQISAKTTMDTALMAAEQAASQEVAANIEGENDANKGEQLSKLADMHGQTLGALNNLAQVLGKPKKRTLVTNPDGTKSVIEE